MFRYGQPNLHTSALMFLVGIFCSVFSTLPLVLLAQHSGLDSLEDVRWIYALVAATAFITFARFNQIITARSMWWVLRNGILRWMRTLFALVLCMIFAMREIDIAASQQLILNWIFISLPSVLACLTLARAVIYRFNNLASNRRKAVFFGLGPQASLLYTRLQRSPILGIEVVGYYAAEPIKVSDTVSNPPTYLGNHENAWDRIHTSEFDIVLIQPDDYYDRPLSTRLFNALNDSTASIYMVPETRWSEGVTQMSAEMAGVPLLTIHDTPILGFARLLKRAFDLILGGIAVTLLSPIMLAVAIAVKLDSPGPILFRQARYGERGRKISVYKFRSMYVNNDKGGPLRQASQHDPRVTRVGRFLRRSSLDELPQLFNVLGGSMSLVGPRPHAVAHNEEYRHQISGYMLRHSIKPGITGWAQINGLRGETDTLDKMQRRIEYDRYYIKNWSLRLDLKILFKTVWTVIRASNAY
jgi:putative colanic acid biosynthesis UDP-glucose lipid carrier transferase